jgi:hypothetical protein
MDTISTGAIYLILEVYRVYIPFPFEVYIPFSFETKLSYLCICETMF